MHALFLTWDGPQQTYLESLFFPIFSRLRALDIRVDVLQLTWATSDQTAAVAEAAARAGVAYRSRHVPEAIRRLALPAIVAYGASSAYEELRRSGADALFPRSLIPMAMALAARPFCSGVDLLFDADGFMADERLDFGGWRASGLPYRALRHVEAQGVRRARAVICRTDRAKAILSERSGLRLQAVEPKIFVVPNAKDGTTFTPGSDAERRATRARFGIAEDAPWIVYVGSIAPQYCPELMLDAFARILQLRPDAKLSCFTFQREALLAQARERGIPTAALHVATLLPREVPAVLAAGDLGIAVRREVPSQRGVCPIKVGEYLLCGVPVVTTRVGDLSEQLGDSEAALLVRSDDPNAAQQIASWFIAAYAKRERLRTQARALGERWFELRRCVEAYANALSYRSPS